jgi:hypothetical protein
MRSVVEASSQSLVTPDPALLADAAVEIGSELDSIAVNLDLSSPIEISDVGLIRLASSKLVLFIHLSITLFCIVAFLGPEPVLWFHVVFVPLMVLHWRLNDDICILTDAELWLRGETRDDIGEGRYFVSRISEFFLSEPFTEETSDKVARGVTWVVWAISVIRLGLMYLR